MNTSGAPRVTLRLLDRADKEIRVLPRPVKGALYDFQHKFKANPQATGLKLQQLKGHSRLWSARINDDHRAVLMRLGDDDWLIVSVQHRRDVHAHLDRVSCGINPVTGGIEYVDLEVVEFHVPAREASRADEVLDHVTAPVAAQEQVDPEDFQAAAARPATMVTTTDDALKEALEGGDFARWKVFLHPAQAKLVARDYSGPARVGGGPGTGKTIVALHRVQHLVDTLPPGHDKPVLLTTYNKNLAADLRSRLLELGGPELLSRSKSACSAAFFGRFGLVRLSTKVAIAPASRAARHSMMWE
jgi:Txe/YoeB family toxin of Txe-Axe toxin-antitoxin module